MQPTYFGVTPQIFRLIPARGFGNLEMRPTEEKVRGQYLMDFHGLFLVPRRRDGDSICLINGWYDPLSLFSWSMCLIVGQN